MKPQRKREAIVLPLSPTSDGWATLQAWLPLSEAEWDQLLKVLEALKLGLVDEDWHEKRRAIGPPAPFAYHEHSAKRGMDHPGSTYIQGCRCDNCRKWNRERSAKSNQRRQRSPTPEHVHGTANGYGNYGCRCPRCREAGSEANKRQAERRLSSVS